MSETKNKIPIVKLNISQSKINDPDYIDVAPSLAAGHQLPYEDNSVSEIISLNLLETLSQSEAIIFLKECRRILIFGGKLKLQILDLDKIIVSYNKNIIPNGKSWIKSSAEMINYFLREGGKNWTYNFSEIKRIGELTGYGNSEIIDSIPGMIDKEKSSNGQEELTLFVCLTKSSKAEVKKKALVSILIAVSNLKYLKDALESATSQTYDNIEIIVCDDTLQNNVKSVIQKFVQDGRLTYHKNSESLGKRLSYAKCLELSRGTFIKFLDDNDKLEPRCVEKLLSMFNDHPTITVAASLRKKIDSDNHLLPGDISTESILPQTSIIEGTSAANLLLKSEINFIGELTSVLVRRDDLIKMKPHYFDFAGYIAPGAGDVSMYLNLLSKGNLAYVAEQLCCIRDHGDQLQYDRMIQEDITNSWGDLKKLVFRYGFLNPNQNPALLYKSHNQDSWQAFDYSGVNTREKEDNNDSARQPLPFYDEWKKITEFKECDISFFSNAVAQQSIQLHFHFLITFAGGQEDWLADTIDAIGEQVYSHWSLSVISDLACPDPIFDELHQLQWIQASSSETISVELIGNVASDWTIIIPAGSKPDKTFLYFLNLYALNHSAWKFIYTDEALLDSSKTVISTFFKPDCNLDMLRSFDYLGYGCAVNTEALAELQNAEPFELSSNYDIFFRIFDFYGKESIGHIQKNLIKSVHLTGQDRLDRKRTYDIEALENHFKRNNIDCTISSGMVENTYFIQYKLLEKPLVSIIIPSKNNVALLQRCINSIYEKTGYGNYEIIIVDNNSNDPETLAYLKTVVVSQTNISVIPYTKPFNYSAINNYAVKQASKGDYILLLNDDTEVLQSSWLERMLEHAQRDDAGAVGARLVYTTKKIQHAGVIIGLYGLAHHPGIDKDISEAGYMNRYQIVQNFSAVTAACLLVKKSKFLEVEGFDEKHLKVLFNDVDLCLKLTEAGYRNIWTPYVTLIHHGSSSLTQKKSQKEQLKSSNRAKNERYTMMKRWGEKIANDPHYNRNLSLSYYDYRLDSVYVAPWDPEIIDRPRFLALKNSSSGSAHYRVTAPLERLRYDGRIWHHVLPDATRADMFLPTAAHLKRMAPDSFLLHSILPRYLDEFKNWRMHAKTALIFGLDDLLTHVPKYNPTRDLIPKNVNIHTLVKNILSLCDRLIVSTSPLYDYFSKKKYISDIRIVPNTIDGDLWLDLGSKRNQDTKIRIGWAGAAQHHGDLAILSDIVKDTQHEFHWIFMGMCPENIKPFIHEFHPSVSFDRYPEKLASLNLDLALAPLEKNKFNEAKSNLRLLEYGILGIPVIASDIFPYQGSPAITVDNSYKEWLQAIRNLASDTDSLTQIGLSLKDWVEKHYLLENNLDLWEKALLP